jgi:hypothetical protein
MASEHGNEYGVMTSTFGKELVVGKLDSGRTRFTDKDESEGVTRMVLGAVSSWVERNFDGGTVIEVGAKRVTIVVEDLPAGETPDQAEPAEQGS